MILDKDKVQACNCQLHALVIPSRRVEIIIALIIIIFFFSFVAGYFLGYSRAADQLCLQAEQQLFSDTIEQSLTNQFGANASEKEQTPVEEAEKPAPQEKNNTLSAVSGLAVVQPVVDGKRYQALLLGGTKKQVDEFVLKMNTLNLPVEARTRVSITKKGSKYVWYQAVTKELADREQLVQLAEKIKKQGRLREIRIIEIG